MVTPRTGQTNVALLREKTKEMFGLLGRSDFVLTSFSQNPTLNARGRVNTQSTSTTSNVIGDLQFSAKLLKPYIEMGVAQQGNGIFYALPNVTINPHDMIAVDSSSWELTIQVEGETLNDNAGSGSSVYQGWVAVRKPEA